MPEGLDTVIQLNNVTKKFKYSHRKQGSLSAGVDNFVKSFFSKIKGVPQVTDFKYALDQVDLDIARGQVVGIYGPNGSGKSTILKIISNVTKPSSGSVMCKGRIAPLIEIGAGFHDEFKGSENVFINGIILGMTKAEVEAQFDSIVTFADLWDYIEMPIKKYSSGMVVRLGFSIAVHSNPEILLIDEVLAVGDANFQEKCIQKIHQFKKDQNVTIVIISHDYKKLEQLCDHILLFEDGKIKEKKSCL